MVDLPKIKKKLPEPPAPEGAPPAPAGMPPPPLPASDIDLPAPAAPRKPEEKPAVPPPPGPGLPEPVPRARADMVEPLKLPETGKAKGAPEIHGSPPVFIKIDKYSDIVKNIQKLKSYAMSLRDALDALSDIEKELTTGISISHKALDDFNTIIAILDSKLLRASAIEDLDVDKAGDVEKYVKGIYEQMDKIKAELKDLS
jgi:hypothetical protein